MSNQSLDAYVITFTRLETGQTLMEVTSPKGSRILRQCDTQADVMAVASRMVTIHQIRTTTDD